MKSQSRKRKMDQAQFLQNSEIYYSHPEHNPVCIIVQIKNAIQIDMKMQQK